MRVQARVVLLAPILGVVIALTVPAGAQAAFGVEERNFEAGTCTEESCTYASPKSVFYTQADGHPPVGKTTFTVNSSGAEPEGFLKRVRVDLPPGLASDPQALEQCPLKEFEEDKCEVSHPGSRVGTNHITAYIPALTESIPVEADVYDLVQPKGLPLDFGIETTLTHEHSYLEGHVSWSSDYHEYFEINNVPKEIEVALGVVVPLKVQKSELVFNGRAGKGDFLTLPSECSSSTVSTLEVESYEGAVSRTKTTTPVGVEGCARVPFAPTAEAKPETSGSDLPDGITAEVKVAQHEGAEEIDTADLKDIHVTLPEGLTLDPSAAAGLKACTAAEIGIGTTNPVTCPAAAKVGELTIETDLPPGTLKGNVYLGAPGGEPITGPPFTIYVDAESELGVSVRLQGQVSPNLETGRLEATFSGNPQLPFSDVILKFNGGALAPVANPLACGTAAVSGLFTPYTGLAAAVSSTPFTTTGCPSPLALKLSQSTQDQPANAGAATVFTFNLGREDGQQYISSVKTVLPEGLVGKIPAVKQCAEAQANEGTCSAETEIGTATVSAGSGSQPYTFTGHVYFTGPYDGAPYGLSIVVPAVAGPFSLGNVVTRATINVEPETARVIVTSTLPRVFKGVPLRVRNISVAVNRPGFILNPTNCGVLATESSVTGFVPGTSEGSVASLSSPFQVADCNALAFKPQFTAKTSATTSKANGASLETTINQPAGEANIKSVLVQLPIEMPSRDSTLQKACLAATFAVSPYNCPSGSFVGSARANTPTLPGKLVGPAILVSHGSETFPDLDLVLEADGVRVIVVGHTKITKGITTTDFASTPDVPVSSITVLLPTGPHSALSAYGSFCAKPLAMPTTITGQNGVVVAQNTIIKVLNCAVRIIRHKVVGDTLDATVQTYVPGRVSVSGKGLTTINKRFARARKTVTLKVPLSRAGRLRGRPFKITLRVGFIPTNRAEHVSKATATAKFT